MRLAQLWNEVWRSLARVTRGGSHAVAALLATAMAISVATTFLAVAGRLWFSPIAVPDLNQLVVPQISRRAERLTSTTTVTFAAFQRLLQSRAFDAVTAFAMLGRFPLASRSAIATVTVTFVAPNYFGTLGLPIRSGPGYGPAADVPAPPLEIVVSQEVWEGLYARSPDDSWRLNGIPVRVVGVAPPGFTGTVLGAGREHVFAPLRSVALLAGPGNYFGETEDTTDAPWSWLTTIGRLRIGGTLHEASQEVNAIVAELEGSKATGQVIPLIHAVLPAAALADIRMISTLLALGSVLLLVMGCVHAASIFVTSGTARTVELQIRGALGAHRRDLGLLLVTQNFVLIGLASACGLVGSRLLLSAVATFEMPGRVYLAGAETGEISLGVPWLLSSSIAVIGAILAAMLVLSRVALTTVPRTRATRRDHTASLVLYGQLVLSLVLLFAAVRFGQASHRALNTNVGFAPSGLISGTVDPSRTLDLTEMNRHVRRLMTHVQAIPGVQGVSIGPPPLNGYSLSTRAASLGAQSVEFAPTMAISLVTDGYFNTLQQPILAGTGVVPPAGAPNSAIPGWLNAEAVSLLSPNRFPIGELITVRGIERPVQIIGVVGNVKYFQIKEADRPGLYLPYWAAEAPVLTALIARTHPGTEPALAAQIERIVFAENPDVPIDRLEPVAERLNELASPQRLGFRMLSAFAGIAIALTGAGVFAVLMGSMTRDLRSTAVRIACGATPFGLVLGVLSRRRRALICSALAGAALLPITDRALSQFTADVPGTFTAALTSVLVITAVFVVALVIVRRRAQRLSLWRLLLEAQ